ncbi:MAG: monoheme cytochrome C [Muricauda sp.]|nr:monoheme cytochrome C [Allomuricauda sp.]MAU26397.1 monoheme cytochrome C [Allomuricauda sp.]MBC29521.1 monoheme cytochrome C [Allomuricauda sp.]|tara:strand:+ start:32541 stop:33005 length:465 start_codon:yes stop_codon:yes gene_type:complete
MNKKLKKQNRSLSKTLITSIVTVLVLVGGLLFFTNDPDKTKTKAEPKEQSMGVSEENFDRIENGIHLATGLVADEGMQLVIQNCTSCHSAKLVIQNRLSREGWQATIKWMQETQNLWNLGPNEEKIIDYLAKNYGPVSKGRRQNLQNVDWYELQ